METKPTPSMVFVVGAGRSGTTLLRLVLDAHSKVYSGPEDQLALVHLLRWHRIDPSHQRFVDELFAFHTASGPLASLWGLEGRTVELLERLRAGSPEERGSETAMPFSDKVAIVRQMVLEALAPNASVWCIKTPNYSLHPWVLQAAAPGAVVVHLVRDGRDVARSYLEGPLRWHLEPPTIARAAQVWARANRSARALERARGLHYHLVRYEDLVRDPATCVTHLCQILGIDLEDSMLAHEQNNRDLSRIAANEHHWHKATARPINTSSVGRGAKAMTTRELATFAALADDELERYGYALGVDPPSWWRRLTTRCIAQAQCGWSDLRGELATRFRWWRRARAQRV